jgi:hypothetical protein
VLDALWIAIKHSQHSFQVTLNDVPGYLSNVVLHEGVVYIEANAVEVSKHIRLLLVFKKHVLQVCRNGVDRASSLNRSDLITS